MSHATTTVTPPTTFVDGTWSITTTAFAADGSTLTRTTRLMAMSDGCGCDNNATGTDCAECDEYNIGAEIGDTIAFHAIELESRIIVVDVGGGSITTGGAISDVLFTSGAGHQDITITGRGWSL